MNPSRVPTLLDESSKHLTTHTSKTENFYENKGIHEATFNNSPMNTATAFARAVPEKETYRHKQEHTKQTVFVFDNIKNSDREVAAKRSATTKEPK